MLERLSSNLDRLMAEREIAGNRLWPEDGGNWVNRLRRHHIDGGGSMAEGHRLVELARRLGTTVEALFTGNGLSATATNGGMSEGTRQSRIGGANMVALLEVTALNGAELDTVAPASEWIVPAHLIARSTVSPPDRLRIVPVLGNSAAPLLLPGTRVLVDLNDQKPGEPGLFLIRNSGGYRIMQLELLDHAEPPIVRCIPVNPTYTTFEIPAERLHIVGRVKGHWAEI